MTRLIPVGFLSIQQAAKQLAVALCGGTVDRPVVRRLKETGFDVVDGQAIANAIENMWTAVDRSSLEAFVIGPGRRTPMKFTAAMSKEIPLLRSPRGGDFNFLRPGKPADHRLVQWFGGDLTQVSVVFRAGDVATLARVLLRARRRKIVAHGEKGQGRPSLQVDVKKVIRDVIEQSRWSPTDSLKALTREVNRRSNCPNVSDDTVIRALDGLYRETGDRLFERVKRRAA